MILKQEKNFETRIFRIIDNGLKIIEKSGFGEIHRTVPFEVISNDFVKLKPNFVQWIIILVIIILLAISGLFLKLFGVEGEGRFYCHLIIVLIGGISAILYHGKNETVLSCYGEEGIEFFKDNPSEFEFNSFLEQLFEKRNEVLKEKYGFVSEFIPYRDQIEKFDLLHSLGVISLDEMNEFKKQLDLLVDELNLLDDENYIKINLN